MDHAILVSVLETQGRLVQIIARVGHRQRAARLDQPCQVQSLDVLHRQDEALAEAQDRVGRDHVGMVQPRRVADLAEEAIENAAAVRCRWLLTTLSTSFRPISVFSAR